MGELIDYGIDIGSIAPKNPLLDVCRTIVLRLNQGGAVAELDALTALSNDRDFETVAKAVREAIETDQPEVGLDRLHTFVIKYVRSLCTKHGATVTRDNPCTVCSAST